MAAQEGKGSIRKSKHIIVKTSLNTPFAVQWHPLEREDTRFILEALEEVMKHIGLKKVEARRRKKPYARKKQDQEKCPSSPSKLHNENETAETRIHGWTDQHIRNQLAIGINEVTKALEKNELLLALVCKSAKPAMMTSHLLLLSASRFVAAGQVPHLSERIAPVLGLTSVLALGFKRNTEAFAEVAKMIIPRIPGLDVPWLPCGNEQPQVSEDADLTDLETALLMESRPEESSPSHKRKRGDSSKSTSPAVTLQTLKVKKIIPNPSKTRKLPKTKKRISK